MHRILPLPSSFARVTYQIMSIFSAEFKFVVRFLIEDVSKQEYLHNFCSSIEGFKMWLTRASTYTHD